MQRNARSTIGIFSVQLSGFTALSFDGPMETFYDAVWLRVVARGFQMRDSEQVAELVENGGLKLASLVGRYSYWDAVARDPHVD